MEIRCCGCYANDSTNAIEYYQLSQLYHSTIAPASTKPLSQPSRPSPCTSWSISWATCSRPWEYWAAGCSLHSWSWPFPCNPSSHCTLAQSPTGWSPGTSGAHAEPPGHKFAHWPLQFFSQGCLIIELKRLVIHSLVKFVPRICLALRSDSIA